MSNLYEMHSIRQGKMLVNIGMIKLYIAEEQTICICCLDPERVRDTISLYGERMPGVLFEIVGTDIIPHIRKENIYRMLNV